MAPCGTMPQEVWNCWCCGLLFLQVSDCMVMVSDRDATVVIMDIVCATLQMKVHTRDLCSGWFLSTNIQCFAGKASAKN